MWECSPLYFSLFFNCPHTNPHTSHIVLLIWVPCSLWVGSAISLCLILALFQVLVLIWNHALLLLQNVHISSFLSFHLSILIFTLLCFFFHYSSGWGGMSSDWCTVAFTLTLNNPNQLNLLHTCPLKPLTHQCPQHLLTCQCNHIDTAICHSMRRILTRHTK